MKLGIFHHIFFHVIELSILVLVIIANKNRHQKLQKMQLLIQEINTHITNTNSQPTIYHESLKTIHLNEEKLEDVPLNEMSMSSIDGDDNNYEIQEISPTFEKFTSKKDLQKPFIKIIKQFHEDHKIGKYSMNFKKTNFSGLQVPDFSVNRLLVKEAFGSKILEHNRKFRVEKMDGGTETGANENSRLDQIKIMILAPWRVGGSFFGEFFNRNPNCFYLFEPLTILQDKFGDPNNQPFLVNDRSGEAFERANEILNDFYQKCKLQKLRLDKEDEYNNKEYNCAAFEKYGICNKFRTSVLMRPPFCYTDQSAYLDQPGKYDINQCFTKLFKENNFQGLKLAENLCKEYPIIVSKISRLPSVFHSLSEKNLNSLSKIYVIVRDPRAVFYSRLKHYEHQNQSNNFENKKVSLANQVCKFYQKLISQKESYEAEVSDSQLLQKIVIYRYEDLAANPKDYYNIIYQNHLHIEANKNVEKFLGFQLNRNIYNSFNPFDKTPIERAYDFRNFITWKDFNDIQNDKGCRKVMDYFGYKQVEKSVWDQEKGINRYRAAKTDLFIENLGTYITF